MSLPSHRLAPADRGGLPRVQTLGASDIRLVQALSDAAREMHRSLSLDEVLGVAAERARTIVGAEEASVTQVSNGDAGTAISAGATVDGRPLTRLDPQAIGAWRPAREVCRTNRPGRLAWTAARPATFVDPYRDGREPAPADGPSRDGGARGAARSSIAPAQPAPPGGNGRDAGPGSWLGAPLVGSDGRNLGLIQLAGKLGGPEFTAADEAVLLQLARMASVAIENARLYEAALDTRSQLAWAAGIERIRAAELRAVINAMGEAVLVCDASGRVSLVNPAADALFHPRPVETYDDLLSRFRLPDPAAIDPVAGPVELALVDPPGRWVELRVYPVPGVSPRAGAAEEAGGRIAVMRDITAARQARAQREAFLGILSHELRTPITTIYAGSKVLAREEPLDAATSHELARDISAEAERLFRLVEDLLVMTRSERGVLQLANEPVLLQRVVAASIRLESAHWPTTRIMPAGPVDLPAVLGDATYVEQVVRNLLSNAAKYSPPEAEVEVRLETVGDEVICRVLDRGRGFQAEEADDLFDLFYRSPTTSAQAAGAGIGLFVCRRLVTSMGGRIWARPRSGGGAEFGFALRRYGGDEA